MKTPQANQLAAPIPNRESDGGAAKIRNPQSAIRNPQWAGQSCPIVSNRVIF
jgi:hypothetical protein